MPKWPLSLAACLLTACAAAPTRYYTLMPDGPVAASSQSMGSSPAAAPEGHLSGGKGLLLRVVEVPAQNDRLQLVVHDPRDTAPIEVQVLNESLWSAPLDDQLQAMLSAQISAEVGLMDLQALPDAAQQPSHQIDVRVTRFDMVWGEGSQLSAIWTDKPTQGALQICRARIRVPADTGVANLVTSQSHAVTLLAGLMAQIALGSTLNLQPSAEVTEFGCT